MRFEVLGEIRQIETIASGHGIRVFDRLVREFGRGNWRKRKGSPPSDWTTVDAVDVELHWYEAHGIGKRKLKIKRYLVRP